MRTAGIAALRSYSDSSRITRVPTSCAGVNRVGGWQSAGNEHATPVCAAGLRLLPLLGYPP